MIDNPKLWPLHPYLPVRRGDGFDAELGILLDRPGFESTVLLVNVYDIGTTIRTEEALLSQECLQYGTKEELCGDGWVPD